MNAKAIKAYLGHASIQTTFDLYGHLMPGNENEAVALVDAYLDRAVSDGRNLQLELRQVVTDGPACGEVVGKSYTEKGGFERCRAETGRNL